MIIDYLNFWWTLCYLNELTDWFLEKIDTPFRARLLFRSWCQNRREEFLVIPEVFYTVLVEDSGDFTDYSRVPVANSDRISCSPQQHLQQNYLQSESLKSFFRPKTQIIGSKTKFFASASKFFLAQSLNVQTKPMFAFLLGYPCFMPYTRKSTTTCHRYGCANHLATCCPARWNTTTRHAEFVQSDFGKQ